MRASSALESFPPPSAATLGGGLAVTYYALTHGGRIIGLTSLRWDAARCCRTSGGFAFIANSLRHGLKHFLSDALRQRQARITQAIAPTAMHPDRNYMSVRRQPIHQSIGARNCVARLSESVHNFGVSHFLIAAKFLLTQEN